MSSCFLPYGKVAHLGFKKKKKEEAAMVAHLRVGQDRMWSHLLHRKNMEKEKLRPTRQKIARAASAATLFGPERGPR